MGVGKRGSAAVSAAILSALLVGSSGASAGTVIWGNDSRGNNSNLEEFDAGTGAMLDSFLAPNAGAQGHIGRGIAVVGSNIFYSVNDSGNVFVTNTSHQDLGIAFSTRLTGIGAIASDGASLYLTASGLSTGSQIYHYSFTGTLLGVTFATPSSGPIASQVGRTGLEFVGGNLIANQGNNEGPYDVYDLAGNLLTAAFIGVPSDFGKTGITFDGTDYYVSDTEAQPSVLKKYDAAGKFLGDVTLLGLPGPNDQGDLQDLSAVVSQVPEPASVALFGAALLGLGLARRRAA